MNLFDKSTFDWQLFLKRIWKYQWTNEHTDLTPEIMDTLYENSAGLVFAVVWLFVESQRAAINLGASGERPEIITPQLIQNLANSSSYKMLKAKLLELKSNAKKTKFNTPFSKDNGDYNSLIYSHVDADKKFAESLKENEEKAPKPLKNPKVKGDIPDLSDSLLTKDEPF